MSKALFADMGLRPRHWIKARQVWMWMLPSIPYLEDYDHEDLTKGVNSALYKFFSTHIILPMAEAVQRYENALPPQMLQQMANCWEVFSQNAGINAGESNRALATAESAELSLLRLW